MYPHEHSFSINLIKQPTLPPQLSKFTITYCKLGTMRMYAYKILRFFNKIVSLKVSSSNSYTNDTVENVTEDAIA